MQKEILQQKNLTILLFSKNCSVKDLVNLVLKKLKIRYSWKKIKVYEYIRRIMLDNKDANCRKTRKNIF